MISPDSNRQFARSLSAWWSQKRPQLSYSCARNNLASIPSQSLRACTRGLRTGGSRAGTARQPTAPIHSRKKTSESPPVPSENKPSRTAELPRRVKAILASRGLTLHQASQTAETLYGRSSPFFLPHNLYYDLGLRTFTPSLHQLFALSRITNYTLGDWLRVFGFDIGDLTRLQVVLPTHRTVLLDAALDDPGSWLAWFRSKPGITPLPEIAPLGRLVDYSSPRRIASLSDISNRSFIYAKLGQQDTFGFPDLLPGSIVRVNPSLTRERLMDGKISEQFFLIEHAKGFCCCRLQAVGGNRIIPVSVQLPFAQIELRLPDEATILGVVDLEIRTLLRPVQAEVPQDLARHWKAEALHPPEMKLGRLLRNARIKMALSFREASAMSRQIANLLGDQRYFTAPGSLSDYETLDAPPRHVHKVVTLCAVYGLAFSAFLKSAGLHAEESGTDPVPDRLMFRSMPAKSSSGEHPEQPLGNESLKELLQPWSDGIPLFLRRAFSVLSGLTNLSLHDVFWIGGNHRPLHPNLAGGLVAIVNRRKKSPVHSRFKPLWQQPIYVILKRDGTYLCACCSLENGTLVIHSYSHGYHRSERLRNFREAEVIGQVVTLARKLS